MDIRTARKLGYKKVGEVAELFGVTPRTVLYYEEEDIIHPAKTPAGTRIYSSADIRRFGVAFRMALLGIPIKILQELACTRERAETGDESGRALCHTLDALEVSVRSRMAELDRLAREIDHARILLKQCWDCPNKPNRNNCSKCPCETGKSDAEILWLTWDVSGELSGGQDRGKETEGPCMWPPSDAPDESRAPQAGIEHKTALQLRRDRLKLS